MLHSEPESYGIRKTLKFAAAAAAMTVLAGCAVAVPLRPLATSSQNSRNGDDFACTANPRCLNGSNHRVAYRRSQPVSGKFDEDPPDFILNSGNQDGMPR
jgi:hypothetical protein